MPWILQSRTQAANRTVRASKTVLLPIRPRRGVAVEFRACSMGPWKQNFYDPDGPGAEGPSAPEGEPLQLINAGAAPLDVRGELLWCPVEALVRESEA